MDTPNVSTTVYPMLPDELLDAGTLRRMYREKLEEMVWLATARGALKDVCNAKNVRAVLTNDQKLDIARASREYPGNTRDDHPPRPWPLPRIPGGLAWRAAAGSHRDRRRARRPRPAGSVGLVTTPSAPTRRLSPAILADIARPTYTVTNWDRSPLTCRYCGAQATSMRYRRDALPNPSQVGDVDVTAVVVLDVITCQDCATSPELAAERVQRLWWLKSRRWRLLAADALVARLLAVQRGEGEVM